MTEINPVVLEIGKIHFEGNVIPHEWFQHIKMPSGNADAIGTLLLADIIYWYRPIKQISEITGKTLPPQKKFKADMFQASASYYHTKFGFTKKQVRDALKRLEDNGYIRREYRTIKTKDGIALNNVMFIEPISTKIMEITYSNALSSQSDTLSPQSDRVSPQSETYTETSTKTSTKKHTHGENENFNKKSVCVLDELNDSEKAAWKWAQSHDFWKGRITTLKQLKSNLEDNKAFRVQFEQTRPAVKPVNGKKVKSVWKKMKIDDCPYCNEQGMIEWCGRIRMEILPCPHNHDEVKRLALKKEATIGKTKSGYDDPAGLKKPKITPTEKARTREKVERMIGGFQAI